MIATADMLNFLECQPGAPNIRSLNRLLRAYISKVPWESVFRIAKSAETPDLARRPRWPDEVWQDAIQLGGGGTCYETNYAFFSLLQALGYTGYLTVNDIGERRGSHAAIVITLDGRKYLVDAGIPLVTALPIDGQRPTRRSTWLHTYTLVPDGADRYQVLRSRHPRPNIYTLLDTPVGEQAYRRVIENDYGENGLYLDRVVMDKVVGERLWLFNSAERPYRLAWFGKEGKGLAPVADGQAVQAVSDCFQMDAGKIQAAFTALNLDL